MMKKYFATMLSIVMLLALLIPLTGCSSDQDKFVGTWTTTMDLTEMVNETIAEDPEMAEYIQLSDFGIGLIFNFDKDGGYQLSVDTDAFNDTYDTLLKDMSAGINDYLEALAKEEGLDISAEDMLALMGMDLDEMVASLMDKDSLLDEFDAESGTYQVKDGRLYLGEDDSESVAYEFVSDTELKLSDPQADDSTDELDFLFPMTLTKQQ